MKIRTTKHLLSGASAWGAAALVAGAAIWPASRAVRAQDVGKGKTTPVAEAKGASGGVANAGGGVNAVNQHWFGVAVENIPPSFSRHLRLKENQGLMVVGVIPQTPAEKAGLKADDLLVELNGIELISQEQLARAANLPQPAEKGKALDGEMASCDIGYLRDGVKLSVKLVPQLRPGNMLVSGVNIQNFGSNGTFLNGAKIPEARNYVLPNNMGVQVGPGYQFDLKNDASASVIREAMKDGQTVVMTQEADPAGNPKNTLSVGGKTYLLPDEMTKVPASVQPLAQEFLNSANRRANGNGSIQNPVQGGNGFNNGTRNTYNNDQAADPRQAEQQRQIQVLLDQNAEQQKQIDRLLKQLEKTAVPQGKEATK